MSHFFYSQVRLNLHDEECTRYAFVDNLNNSDDSGNPLSSG